MTKVLNRPLHIHTNGEDAVKVNGSTALNESGEASSLISSQMKVSKVALAAGNANAFAFAWQNPESTKVLVHRVIVNVTTAGGTASSVINVGTAASATTTSDNLIDGMDANATGPRDNVSDGGTNGKSRQLLDEKDGTTDYVTGQILTQNAASLAGYAYIFYTAV